jgi:hypothetical protein
MSFINYPIKNAIILYLILITIILYFKPRIIFDQDGSLKLFGLSSEKTIFSFCVISLFFAIISYYLFTLIRIIF